MGDAHVWEIGEVRGAEQDARRSSLLPRMIARSAFASYLLAGLSPKSGVGEKRECLSDRPLAAQARHETARERSHRKATRAKLEAAPPMACRPFGLGAVGPEVEWNKSPKTQWSGALIGKK